MDLSKEKLEIIQWVVQQTKSSRISAIAKVIESIENQDQDDNKIVGFRKVGDRVSKKQLVESIKRSLEQIDNNELVSLEKIENDSDQW